MTTSEKNRLTELVHQIERSDFECQAGPLYNFVPWHDLRKMAGLPAYSEYSIQKQADSTGSPEINKAINDILSRDEDYAG